MKKILYGICGIGNGHFFRQTPVIDYLLEQQHQILFFAYGESYKLLSRYENNKLVKIIEVAVPYFIGNNDGLDFVTSAQINSSFDYNKNLNALAEAQRWLGKPDLVLSDYEPVSAQYGYAHGVEVVTIDQQSKFLTGSTPQSINGFNCEDEVMRLRMFFPQAKRLASSFFKVAERNNVTIFPPVYRKSIQNIVREKNNKQFIIYLSSQRGFKQNLEDIVNVVAKREEQFHIFSKDIYQGQLPSNVIIYSHGTQDFEKLLATCSGVISTAGHNLLGECMYLNIPVYAMPLDLYEQQLNASIIADFRYGINHNVVSEDKLDEFISKIDFYLMNIKHSSILFKQDGKNQLLSTIENLLNT